MAAVAGIIAAELLAHGGTGGLIVEGTLVLGLLVLVFAVWRSERRAQHDDEGESWARFKSHFDDK